MQRLVSNAPDQSRPAHAAEQPAPLPAFFTRLYRIATWYRDLCADGEDAWRQFPDPDDDFARCQRHVLCQMLLALAGKVTFLS